MTNNPINACFTNFILNPQIYNIPKVMAQNTKLVPKSGCMKIRNVGSVINPATGSRLLHVLYSCLRFDNNRARQIIINNLANSDGCKVNDPICIHRCAPNALVPANLTTINDNALITNKVGAHLYNMR